MAKYLNQKLTRYILVGIATAAVDYLAFSIILMLSENYLLAENLKLPFMLGFNYTAHRLFTFNSKQHLSKELSKYALANILIFVVANLTLIILVNLLNNVQLAKFVQLVSMPIFTFLVLNLLVYGKRSI